MRFRTTVEMRTEKGPVREKNEDCTGLLQTPDTRQGVDAVYLVADGLGGHERGEVASAMAVDLLLGAYKAGDTVETHDLHPIEPSLAGVIRRIGEVISDAGLTGEAMHRDPWRAGMATTLTAALLVEDTLYLGHVGDSRAYLLRGGQIAQLTEDHSTRAERRLGLSLEEGERPPARDALTQVLGLDHPVVPYTRALALEEGDTLLLCTDGLHGFLDDRTIAAIAQREGSGRIANALVAQALARGSDDNITALLVSFAGPEGPSGGHPQGALPGGMRQDGHG